MPHRESPPSTAPQEIELKLLIDNADVEKLKRHPFIKQTRVGKARRESLVSTYYDTADAALRKSRAALRVRKTASGWVQTFKSGGSAQAALTRRAEWEMPVAQAALDIDALCSAIGKRVPWNTLLRTADLRPLFVTEFVRTAWDLKLPDGSMIELALDQGVIRHGRRRDTICEIELELKAGRTGALFDCALQLLENIPLQAGTLSKAERGHALCRPKRAPAIATAKPLDLPVHISIEDGFRLIAAACLGQIEANQRAVSAGEDPEGVHQMRIGLRRLQSALDLFGKAIPLPPELQAQLDWLSAHLGPVRDWEVLAGTTLPSLAAKDSRFNASKLAQAARSMARARHADARIAVQSPQFTKLILSFQNWLESATWRKPGQTARGLDGPLTRFADRCLSRGQSAMLKRSRKTGVGAKALHKLRLTAKAARYSTEFFTSLYPAKPLNAYHKTLVALQEELGWRNDIEVARHLLLELAAARPELRDGIGLVRGHLGAHAENGTHKLRQLLGRLAAIDLPERKS